MATQGDNRRDNRVTSYLIRYGYDGKTWISYGAGQVNLQLVFMYLYGFASRDLQEFFSDILISGSFTLLFFFVITF